MDRTTASLIMQNAVDFTSKKLHRFKPYPEYKDSGVEWLGKIPAHWEVKRVKRLFKVINGSTPKSGEPHYWDGDIPWVTPDDLGELTSKELLEPRRYITQEGYQSCGTFIVPRGSLVLSTRAPIGHLAIAGVNLCTNQGCRSLVFRKDRDQNFFYYLFFSARSELESWGQGSTFKELSKSNLEFIPLIEPPLKEQQLISNFLDQETAKIDALISKKERLIELLQEKRTALISQAVTKGLNPNVPMKDSGIEWLGKIPAHWEAIRLKYLIIEPLKYGANEIAELNDPDLPRYIRITDIDESGKLREDTFKSLPKIIAEEYLLRQGDILFARSGATVGKSFLYDESWGLAAYAGYLIRARLKQNIINPRFTLFFLQSRNYWDWLMSNFIQATIQNVSAEKYSDLVIPLPNINEQESIASFLDQETAKIDALISKVREAIDRLKEYRTALILAAVTGKIDVRREMA